MSFKYLTLIFTFFLLLTVVFAASPSFSGTTTADNVINIVGDRNYVDYNVMFYSGAASDADEDLNQESCEVTFDSGATWIQHVDEPGFVYFDTDTNNCVADVNTINAQFFDDIQVSFRISDDGFADTLSDMTTWWIDNNAPATATTETNYDSYTTLRIANTDKATNTGNGVDFNQTQYMIDGNGTWVTSTSSTTDFNVMLNDFSPGTYDLVYWSTDDFDNNTGILTISFDMTGAAPTITGDTVIKVEDPVRFYSGTDRDYFDVPVTVLSGVVTDSDLDFNTLSCEYSVSYVSGEDNTWFSGDWNTDTNQCQFTLVSVAGADDFNFNFNVWDDVGNNTEGVPLNVWYDETAPTTSATANNNYNSTSVVLTSTDSATTTGDGSGVQNIWYSIDGGTWTNSSTNPLTVNVTGVGDHTLYFYSQDNLDNNEMEGTGLWEKPVTVRGIGAQTCTLLPTVLLVLVAAAIIVILGLFVSGNLSIGMVIPIAISMLSFFIILYIAGVFSGVICQ